MDTRTLLAAAVKCAGSQSKLAADAGVSQVTIHKALKNGRVTAELAVKLERASQIPRHLWRPDMWPAPAKQDAAA